MKLIFVTGGAISGLGKGVTSSSIGKLIKSTGKSVGMVKMDPYLQIDAGTMSPYEHGEVFVTEDGGECDLDIGNYERFINQNLSKNNNITTGKVYQKVIEQERAGKFLGKTVQLFPHIPNEIKAQISTTAKNYDVTIIEVGGTIGDIENAPFLEAIRGFKKELGEKNVCVVIVAPLLHLAYSGEIKTKLIQHSVSSLRTTGVIPDAVVCRTEVAIDDDIMSKLSRTCDLDIDAIFEAKNVDTIYQVPEILKKQGFLDLVFKNFGFNKPQSDLSQWNSLVNTIVNPEKTVTIGIVGKYTNFSDTYKSISESFIHAGVANNSKVKIIWIDSEHITSLDDVTEKFASISGILIPGGFGERGVEGKILAVQYARENNIPFLGICLGLQVAVIEYARNMCDISDAHSLEFDEFSQNLVIDLMEEQKSITQKGGTMRLGSYPAHLTQGSHAETLYTQYGTSAPLANGDIIITERHRHRYEVNSHYHQILQEKGLILSGMSPDRSLVEFIELQNHPFFIATQAHPEFISRLDTPHPLFFGLVQASLKKS